MNKKFLISWVAVFVVWMLGSFLVHAVMLGEAYASMGTMMRPEADQQAYFPYMLAAHVIMAGAFVWIYQRGNEEKPWLQQGLRYGVAVALLAPVPVYLIYFAVQPWPAAIVTRQIIGDGLLVIVLAVLVAALNKPAASN